MIGATTRIASIEALKATHRHALAALDALFASLQQRAFAKRVGTGKVLATRSPKYVLKRSNFVSHPVFWR